MLFGDGSVHFVADNISIAIWQALGSMAGGESVDIRGASYLVPCQTLLLGLCATGSASVFGIPI